MNVQTYGALMIKPRDLRIMQFVRRHAIDTEKMYNCKMAAALAIKNQVISLGRNCNRTHPMAARYGRHHEGVFLHAEIAAIVNALNHVDKSELLRSTLYIHRVKHLNEYSSEWVDGLAKPCTGCMAAIVAFGIKKVVFSTNTQAEYDHFEM